MWVSVSNRSRKCVPCSRTFCNSKWAISKACPCSSCNEITVLIEDDGRHSDCIGWPGIQVPCDDKHQTSRHTVCMLCACGPVASVIGLAEVQRGYEVIVNTPVAPHSSGFAAISYTHPHCSPQVVRYNSPGVCWPCKLFTSATTSIVPVDYIWSCTYWRVVCCRWWCRSFRWLWRLVTHTPAWARYASRL